MATFRGPWADTALAAEFAALDAVGVLPGEYVEVRYLDGMRLEPVAGDRPAIDVEVSYSEIRDQCRATLRQVPPAEVPSS